MIRRIVGRLLVRAGRFLLRDDSRPRPPPREVPKVERRVGSVGFTQRSLRMVEPPPEPPPAEVPEPPLRGSLEAQRGARR